MMQWDADYCVMELDAEAYKQSAVMLGTEAKVLSIEEGKELAAWYRKSGLLESPQI